ncbi:Syntaxin-132 [Acorus gramineus]|uniref:Syntaxin-132 n=1 Tax=Acorus gramineus TaxID=55184 RepID=A0AAV9BX83_ACOGR|nr:Syntaxin-132 [Acorus gramineus]
MNDLLTDSFIGTRNQPHREGDVELGVQSPTTNSDLGMEDFFKQVREIEKHMEKLSTLLQKLQDANEGSKTATKASAVKAIKQRMEKDVNEVGKVARGIKAKLEELERDNLANRKKKNCGKGTGVDRSRMVMTNALKKKLKDRVNDFQILRQTIQNDNREVVKRKVFTTIDNLIETGQSEQIFEKAIQEMGRGQVLDTLQEIQERNDAVREIEKKLLDLHQVFMDLAILVESQGEILDNIENQVMNTVDHVQSGNDALRTAKTLQKKSRKCMMIAIIVFLMIAIILSLSILKPWKK